MMRNQTRMSPFTTSIQHYTESSNQFNKKKKRKGIEIGKDEIKLSLFTNDMIVYVENPRELAKTPGTNQQLQQGCKIQGYYTKVSFFPIYQQMKNWNLKLKTQRYLHQLTHKNKYLGINLIKHTHTRKTTKL